MIIAGLHELTELFLVGSHSNNKEPGGDKLIRPDPELRSTLKFSFESQSLPRMHPRLWLRHGELQPVVLTFIP